MGKAYIDSKRGACDYDVLVKKGLEQFVGRTHDEVDEISRGCFEKYMRKSIYRLAYREIVRHKEAGRKVILLTASVNQLIRPLADYLEVDELFALNPIYVDGKMTADAEKPFSYENGKLILAREYIQENNIDLKDCFFYSDSSSDMPLMEKVGHPRPTNPTRRCAASHSCATGACTDSTPCCPRISSDDIEGILKANNLKIFF